MIFFIYLFNCFIRRAKEFLRHWYVKSFFIWTHLIVSLLEKSDRYFALKITWRYLFEPLYQDRTIVGYILGFIFRLNRLFIGGLFYLLIIISAAAMYLAWLALPVYVIYKIIIYGN